MRRNITRGQVSMDAPHLVVGRNYRFDPPIKATAISRWFDTKICEPRECIFERGQYCGVKNGNRVFLGKPINDPRAIPVPLLYERGTPEEAKIREKTRESYFCVLFIGGSRVIPDADDEDSKHGQIRPTKS